ncbi:MAG: prepilin-type N-terminal cleavage/methylation domain-containing protein [Candidatus Omnitrophica bacterium]|nr:prepilin-type N-terminal cleavage/methylation domain-containing protein [Candidatus Omnitrophota bacterium]
MRERKGFTLIEVVVSTFVLAVGILSLLGTFLSGLILVESSRNRSVAAADARAVFEEMRRLSGTSLAQVTAQNWSTWGRNAGLTALPNEQITVAFRNPAADPVEATVTVRWQERNRDQARAFTGLVTRR